MVKSHCFWDTTILKVVYWRAYVQRASDWVLLSTKILVSLNVEITFHRDVLNESVKV